MLPDDMSSKTHVRESVTLYLADLFVADLQKTKHGARTVHNVRQQPSLVQGTSLKALVLYEHFPGVEHHPASCRSHVQELRTI